MGYTLRDTDVDVDSVCHTGYSGYDDNIFKHP